MHCRDSNQEPLTYEKVEKKRKKKKGEKMHHRGLEHTKRLTCDPDDSALTIRPENFPSRVSSKFALYTPFLYCNHEAGTGMRSRYAKSHVVTHLCRNHTQHKQRLQRRQQLAALCYSK